MDTSRFERDYANRRQWSDVGDGREVPNPTYTRGMEILAAYENEDAVEVAPFNDDMTKDDMCEHLYEVHGVRSIRNMQVTHYASGTKVTKDQMRAFHDALHERQDDPTAEFYVSSRAYRRSEDMDRQNFTLGGYPLPTVKHQHTAVVVTSEQQAALAAVRNNKRAAQGVLSVQDRKVLTQLVDNDFHSLKQEMKAFAADALAAKVKEINIEWDEKEKSIPDFAAQATTRTRTFEDERRALEQEYQRKQADLRAAYDDDLKKIVDKASDKGVKLSEDIKHEVQPDGRTVKRTVHKATVEGRKEAMDLAQRENKLFLDRALLDLEKQRMTAQRQVLLSGVPQEAMPIVESIPDAKTLMVEAQKDRAAAGELTS